jgi:hypothetical protein
MTAKGRQIFCQRGRRLFYLGREKCLIFVKTKVFEREGELLKNSKYLQSRIDFQKDFKTLQNQMLSGQKCSKILNIQRNSYST